MNDAWMHKFNCFFLCTTLGPGIHVKAYNIGSQAKPERKTLVSFISAVPYYACRYISVGSENQLCKLPVHKPIQKHKGYGLEELDMGSFRLECH